MKKGDHLRINLGMYFHHGIDRGDGFVIHFGRGLNDMVNAKVEIVSRAAFANGRKIGVVDSERRFSADEVVQRAESRLDECGYDLFDNNCEHFVTWCRTGKNCSPQIEKTETMVRQATAALSKPVLQKAFLPRVARIAGSKLAIKLATKTTGAALIGDAAQATAELVASQYAWDQQDTRKIGISTGAVTTATVGTLMGGPVGGVASLTLWAIGQVFADQAVEGGKKLFHAAMASGNRR
jgi:hypothetical protein